MQVDRDDIEASLLKKGFVRDDRKKDHRYFYHELEGRRTGPYAYTSHGSRYKVYGDSLLNTLRFQLRLQTARQVVDLVKCPMSREEYEQLLRNRGLLG
jgi:hypothetical protein